MIPMIQKVTDIAESALRKIGASDIRKKAALAVKFARHQSPEELTLDGKAVVGIAVDIATVFSLEGTYRQWVDGNGNVRTAETIQALSIVVVGEDVRLCKSTYDVISGSPSEKDQYLNPRYWSTDVDQLTESYIC